MPSEDSGSDFSSRLDGVTLQGVRLDLRDGLANRERCQFEELQKHGSSGIVIALVGNKADLHEKREVTVQEGMDYAENNGMFFTETSAKTADNINQLFEEIAKRLLRPSSS